MDISDALWIVQRAIILESHRPRSESSSPVNSHMALGDYFPALVPSLLICQQPFNNKDTSDLQDNHGQKEKEKKHR